MLPYPLRWAPTVVIVLVVLAQNTHASTVSLLDLLPKCASKCLESFISTDYPRNACSAGCDLTYLCTENTKSGYTLGEAALRCSLSLCSMEVAMSFDTYSICDSVPGALPQTHPTIVATITASGNPTTTTRPTIVTTTRPTSTRTTTEATITKTDHTSTTTTFQSPTSTTESTDSHTTTDEPTSTSTNTSPEPTSSETSEASSKGSALNSGAVIGVSVASGIAGFFIIGVIIFFCCRKIRRKAQDREFFEIGGHMSEPPDFNFPPRRPPMGPRPSPGSHPTDSESVRLVTPADTVYHHPEYNAAPFPAVIITEPEEDRDQNHHRSAANTDRPGHQSSTWEYETASIASSRTVSDLLPDKPTYELYPRPLRWSLKKPRPSSGATFIEDETGSRNHPSPSIPQSSFSHNSERSHGRKPMTGLPANPRAMKYGFASPGQTQAMKASARGKKPVYSNEGPQSSRQLSTRDLSRYPSTQVDYDDDLDNYWKKSPDAGFVGAKVIQPQHVSHSPMQGHGSYAYENSPKYAGYEFEFGFGNDPSSAQGSHHSGGFRPLTPVREIRTPMGEVQNPMGSSSSSSNVSTPTPAPRYPPRQALDPGPPTRPQEVVSRPRIVRQDDIKRVQIRRPGTNKPLPSPKEVNIPYCPDDYWVEQNNEATSAGYNVPTATPPRSYGGHNNDPKGVLGMPKKKPAPTERQLTPSRRGADLILQVE
ncbi:uncharacterized protein BDV14DRAFT_107497 [Aspergillus stella-maris]|uniref:uncharacterized protein n=1 Tax=Aspergillus stella-maris TaxID=1810926 RepID=UPI003CCD55E0